MPSLSSSMELAYSFYIDGCGGHVPTSLLLDWFAIYTTTSGFQTDTLQESQIDWAEEYDQQNAEKSQSAATSYFSTLWWSAALEAVQRRYRWEVQHGQHYRDHAVCFQRAISHIRYDCGLAALCVASIASQFSSNAYSSLPVPTSSGLPNSVLRRATIVTNPLRLLCPARRFPMRLNKEMMSEDDLLSKDQDSESPITYPYKAENKFGRSFEGCKGFSWFGIFVSNGKVRDGVCSGLECRVRGSAARSDGGESPSAIQTTALRRLGVVDTAFFHLFISPSRRLRLYGVPRFSHT